MIELKNIVKKYNTVTVYNDFTLSLEEGKITCLLGGSGCGKTTLLNIISGLTSFDGEVPTLKCSYIFQSPRLVPNLSVRDNLLLICKDENRVDELLEKVGLSNRAESYPVNLSGGEAQRVSIARAFLYDSDILLMDEPFASLDLKLKNKIIDLFCSIWREDRRTVLMVTHNVEEAASLAQRAVVLSGGKIVYDVTPDSIIPRPFDSAEELRRGLISALLK